MTPNESAFVRIGEIESELDDKTLCQMLGLCVGSMVAQIGAAKTDEYVAALILLTVSAEQSGDDAALADFLNDMIKRVTR